MSSENRHLIRQMFDELWSHGKLAVANEIFTSNYANHDPATPDFGKGPEAEKQVVTLYRNAFPDLQFAINHMIDAGSFVTSRFTARGTHKAEFWGIAATNRLVSVEGTIVSRVSRGRIEERWVMWDALGLMNQLRGIRATKKKRRGRPAH